MKEERRGEGDERGKDLGKGGGEARKKKGGGEGRRRKREKQEEGGGGRERKKGKAIKSEWGGMRKRVKKDV